MTVQFDSLLVSDQNMWYIDMYCSNNSISFLEKKTFGTHEQTCYVHFNFRQRQQCVCTPSNVYQISLSERAKGEFRGMAAKEKHYHLQPCRDFIC